MKTSTLLPCIDGIHVEHVATKSDSIILHLSAIRSAVSCPLCCQPSQHIHSHYRRMLTDLPWNRVAVRIHLNVRKFFCDNEACPRKVFTEPLPELTARYARKTVRLQSALYLIGYALGGEAGARVAVGLGIGVSPDVLLDRVRQVGKQTLSQHPVRVLGVDDFAFRKGTRYGTVLVDLEQRRVLDLLPDRTAESLSDWLKQHPEIEIVSRDRASAYAEGAREGAPQAVQVADRFHLLKNVTEMLQRLLLRHQSKCRQAASALTSKPVVNLDAPSLPKAPSQRAQQESAARREQRLARYERVVQLHKQGCYQREIARTLGLAPNTVKKWLSAGQFHEQAKPVCRRSPDRFADYLRKRWEEGCCNAVRLHEELKEQGYNGSIAVVQRYVQSWREKPRGQHSCCREPSPSARSIVWWLLGHSRTKLPEQKVREQAFLKQLCQLCPDVNAAKELVLRFIEMVKNRSIADFTAWLEEAKGSHIPELIGFAKNLQQDEEAVRAALSSEWSNGQVEGQVNRLKLVKRSMYGRAKFDLLKARVLPLQQAA